MKTLIKLICLVAVMVTLASAASIDPWGWPVPWEETGAQIDPWPMAPWDDAAAQIDPWGWPVPWEETAQIDPWGWPVPWEETL